MFYDHFSARSLLAKLGRATMTKNTGLNSIISWVGLDLVHLNDRKSPFLNIFVEVSILVHVVDLCLH